MLPNKKTNAFKVVPGNLEPIERMGNGSINNIIEQLGYEKSQIHMVLTSHSKNFDFIACKIFTREPIFILRKEGSPDPTINLLQNEIMLVDWDDEYDSHNIESILEAGIEELSYEFLSSILELKGEGSNVYLAPRLQLYLSFKNQKLVSFASSEWENASAKWLKNLNLKLFTRMLEEAKQFHETDLEAMEEVNLQCEALQAIPQAVKNEFVPLHDKRNGTTNFYNLLAAHYKSNTVKSEFISVNKGRYTQRNQTDFEIGGFVYQFSEDGRLEKAYKL